MLQSVGQALESNQRILWMLTETAKLILARALRRFGLALIKYNSLEELRQTRRAADDLRFLQRFGGQDVLQILKYLPLSHAQFRQDLFVLNELAWKTGGYFVEFGATDGLHLSNTWLLEQEFGWHGILAEPARRWHGDLAKNRRCGIDTHCVWRESDAVLQFRETEETGLSTIADFTAVDQHAFLRRSARLYEVTTISLLDLLARYDAPTEIDYLSIDTEGSEFDILSKFDFGKYRIRIMTVEHNFTPARQKICSLLRAHGYRRTMEDFSSVDDWYVLRT
jgi:FkbM family methyltransferase